VLFAHQGGWDEALFVVVPLVIFGFLLFRAQRRAEREATEIDPPDATDR
jgi:preprotein translocase subunit YajC